MKLTLLTQMKDDYATNSRYLTFTFLSNERMYNLRLDVEGLNNNRTIITSDLTAIAIKIDLPISTECLLHRANLVHSKYSIQILVALNSFITHLNTDLKRSLRDLTSFEFSVLFSKVVVLRVRGNLL